MPLSLGDGRPGWTTGGSDASSRLVSAGIDLLEHRARLVQLEVKAGKPGAAEGGPDRYLKMYVAPEN